MTASYTLECLVDSWQGWEDKAIRILARIKSMKSSTSTEALVGHTPMCVCCSQREQIFYGSSTHRVPHSTSILNRDRDRCCFDCWEIKNVSLRGTCAMQGKREICLKSINLLHLYQFRFIYFHVLPIEQIRLILFRNCWPFVARSVPTWIILNNILIS